MVLLFRSLAENPKYYLLVSCSLIRHSAKGNLPAGGSLESVQKGPFQSVKAVSKYSRFNTCKMEDRQENTGKNSPIRVLFHFSGFSVLFFGGADYPQNIPGGGAHCCHTFIFFWISTENRRGGLVWGGGGYHQVRCATDHGLHRPS